ncbi:MAG: 4Fe-4S binding protein [Chloroflexi bacterium]|nr:4Fe-4S binding protein [Chloroflexota bacterium]
MSVAIPEIDLDKCTGCGDCVEFCPLGIVSLVNNKVTIVRPEDCIYCTDCELFCPHGAVSCPFEIVLAGTGAPPSSPHRRK